MSVLSPDQIRILAVVSKHLGAMADELEKVEKEHAVSGDDWPHWFFHTILTYDGDPVGEFTVEIGSNEFWYSDDHDCNVARKILGESS